MNTYTDNTKLVLLQEFQPKNAHLQKKSTDAVNITKKCLNITF